MTEISKLLEREILPVDTTEAMTSEQIEVVDEAQNVFKDLVDGITDTPKTDAGEAPNTIH